MNNNDLISRSEVRKMIEKKWIRALIPSHAEIYKKLLSELDKLPSGWIPVTDKYTYSEYCEYPHSNSEYEIYFGKREVYDIDDWRNMMVIKAHSYHHDDLPPHP